jgi:hypothetical protein
MKRGIRGNSLVKHLTTRIASTLATVSGHWVCHLQLSVSRWINKIARPRLGSKPRKPHASLPFSHVKHLVSTTTSGIGLSCPSFIGLRPSGAIIQPYRPPPDVCFCWRSSNHCQLTLAPDAHRVTGTPAVLCSHGSALAFPPVSRPAHRNHSNFVIAAISRGAIPRTLRERGLLYLENEPANHLSHRHHSASAPAQRVCITAFLISEFRCGSSANPHSCGDTTRYRQS